MAKSNSLGRAKDAKQDEFYTQIVDKIGRAHV